MINDFKPLNSPRMLLAPSYNVKGNFKKFVECLTHNSPTLAMALTIDAADNSLMTSPDIKKILIHLVLCSIK
jgi:hypothetical protein